MTWPQVTFFESLTSCRSHSGEPNSLKLTLCDKDICIYNSHISFFYIGDVRSCQFRDLPLGINIWKKIEMRTNRANLAKFWSVYNKITISELSRRISEMNQKNACCNCLPWPLWGQIQCARRAYGFCTITHLLREQSDRVLVIVIGIGSSPFCFSYRSLSSDMKFNLILTWPQVRSGQIF